MKDLPITQYLEDLSSDKPTPGGGTAAPLTAAIGLSCGLMVANMTVGKKRYEDVQEEIEQIIVKAEGLKAEFEQLIEQDSIDFGPLSEAFKMPSTTQEEKDEKDFKLQRALKGACSGPLTTMGKTLEALELFDRLSEIGNKMLMSDVGVGASSCKTALEAGQLSVLANTTMMKDEETKYTMERDAKNIKDEGIRKANQVIEKVHEAM